jgi:hypothetical protein
MPKTSSKSKAAKKAEKRRLKQQLAEFSSSESEEEEPNSAMEDNDDDDSSSSSSSADSSSPPPKKKHKVVKQEIPRIDYKTVTVGSAAVEKMTGREQPEHLKSRKLSAMKGIVRELGKRIRFGTKNHSTVSL